MLWGVLTKKGSSDAGFRKELLALRSFLKEIVEKL